MEPPARKQPGTEDRNRLRSGVRRSEHGNNQRIAGVESTVFATSRWFPLTFALLQTVRHVGLIGYDYWRYEERFRVVDSLKRDLARPLFEPSGFCGAWISYASGQTADLGLDMPAYAAGMLLHSVVNWSPACDATLTTPRGQLIAAVFVMPVWFLTGLSIRRLSQRRWRRRAGRFWRLPWWFGFVVCRVAGLFDAGGESWQRVCKRYWSRSSGGRPGILAARPCCAIRRTSPQPALRPS